MSAVVISQAEGFQTGARHWMQQLDRYVRKHGDSYPLRQARQKLEPFVSRRSSNWRDFQDAVTVIARAEIAAERSERQKISAAIKAAYRPQQLQRSEVAEFWFREVSRSDIAPETERAAIKAMVHAGRDLGIQCDLRWVRPERAELAQV